MVILPIETMALDLPLYYGKWVPYAETTNIKFISSDRLIIGENKLVLPGGPEYKIKGVYNYDNEAKCIVQIYNLMKEIYIEIKVTEGPYENSERLFVTVFGPTTLEAIKASYAYKLIPTPLGKKQKVSRPPRPKEVAGWWFIRENHNPCDEGTNRGTWICSVIAHKKADESLNFEWKRLMSIVSKIHKKSLIANQNKWLKSCSEKCVEKITEGASVSWGLSEEAFCLADQKIKRSKEIFELYGRIQNDNSITPKLTN
jgi:uncharacterized protein YecT (DUF1311 family)